MSEIRSPRLISVIITTYNTPSELRLSLLSYDLQTRRDFELIIADDGSGPETAMVIQDFQAKSDLPVFHVWHEDNGFRKCEILNRAIEAAHGDYLLFTDGDCIARPDFVEVHYQEAEPLRYLSGTYNNLPEALKPVITAEAIRSGDVFKLKWLRRNGLQWTQKSLRLIQNPIFTGIMNRLTTTAATWNGCNVSGWKSDVQKVNGFDERMGHGGLDRELGLRLNNINVRGKQIRFKAICLHVDHPRGYANKKTLINNLAIRAATVRQHVTFTPYGIRKSA